MQAQQYESELAQLTRELAALKRPMSARVPLPVRALSPRARALTARSPPSESTAIPAYLPSAPPGIATKRPPASADMPWLKEGRRDVNVMLQPLR